jgi:hypothetical protein
MRATILVILEDTDMKQAALVKELIDKVVEKIPKVETEISIRGK